jgi:hypothetical protein
MTKKQILTIVALLILMAGQPAKAFYSDAFLKDFWNIESEGIGTFNYSVYEAESFTATSTYPLAFFRVKLSHADTPGNFYISLREATWGGLPTGADICEGEINGNLTTIDFQIGEWYEMSCGNGIIIERGKQYAIVLRADADSGCWILDMDNGYSGGIASFSEDNGINWSADENTDYMFEVYSAGNSAEISDGTSTFLLKQEISYGDIFIIFFLTIFTLMFIADFIYRFIYKIKVNFRH